MNTKIHNLINSFYSSDNKILYFKSLSNIHKSYLLYSVNDANKQKLLHHLNDNEIISIFNFLDPDEITDILQVLPKRRQKQILVKLNRKYKNKVKFLLKFTSNSAAGLMSLNYIIVSDTDSKKDIEKRLEKHLALGKREPTILVIDTNNNMCLGELRISALLFSKSGNLYSNLKKIPVVNYNDDQEEVIDVFRKNRHEKVVVLGEDNSILGIIHAKDVFKVIEEEDTEDYYAMAGLDKQEDISDPARLKVKFRLGWLLINLATAFLAAWVVTLYEDTISKYVLLAAFMPIIAGMGGNAATQTTAILIRSLALKKIDSKLTKKIVGSEIFAALINGFIIGLIVGLIAYFYNQNLLFGLIVAIALIANMVIAALFGTLVPLILKLFNIDPASSSTVFVTTATDVFGFFILLGLASVFLL